MLQTAVKAAEEEAIALYKQTVRVADEEGYSTTRRLFEEILAEEEEHHGKFIRLVGK